VLPLNYVYNGCLFFLTRTVEQLVHLQRHNPPRLFRCQPSDNVLVTEDHVLKPKGWQFDEHVYGFKSVMNVCPSVIQYDRNLNHG